MAVNDEVLQRDAPLQKSPSVCDTTPRQLSTITQDQRNPGPATSGSFYNENDEPVSILFRLCPDPTRFLHEQDWWVEMLVKCRDVPRLMREGFYWDTANVIPEEGYVTFDGENPKRVRWYGKKYAGTRHYFLKDLQQPLRWMATIEVLVVDYYALCQFDLSQLCRERIRLGSALSQASPDHYIWKYRYDQVPWGCFNLVYGDMPMEGWWPWPRKEPEADKKDEKDSGASRNGINGDHESLI